MNSMLLEKVQSILFNAILDKEFWAEALSHRATSLICCQQLLTRGKFHWRYDTLTLLLIMIAYVFLDVLLLGIVSFILELRKPHFWILTQA